MKNVASTSPLDARQEMPNGPSFSLRNRIERAIFSFVWAVCAAWTPPQAHRWRVTLLRAFGARIGRGVRIYGSTRIWHPANLAIADEATVGPRVTLYNQGRITIGSRATVSQGAHVCASTHDVSDPYFQLLLRPIAIEQDAWIAAEAFVGPGVTVREGAVLGARAAAFRNLDAWTIYSGNPASSLRPRLMRER